MEAERSGEVAKDAWSSSKECHEWEMNGKCRFGDSCIFFHDASVLPGNLNSFGPCHDFRDKGRCRYGVDCKFLHEIDYAKDSKIKLELDKRRKPNGNGCTTFTLSFRKIQREDRAGSRDRKSEDATRRRASSIRDKVSFKKEILCWNMAQFGKCRFGDRCRYSHETKSDKENKKLESVESRSYRERSRERTYRSEERGGKGKLRE
mmetsp:Transcript_5522/g.8167  ORF Transcript_5522/g.8167 Transcript_5522/m.8167 type:complete len:205 (+) Transcript_5522:31-645(+)